MAKYIGERINVLDKGFVVLVDYMGDDSAIVQGARISYGEGTKSVRDDRNLIRYLIRNYHTSPLELVEFKFHVRCPIEVARQWFRHRSANFNEISGRYSVITTDRHTLQPSEWRLQAKNNKQGSQGLLAEADKNLAEKFCMAEHSIYNTIQNTYNEFLEAGIAREQARKILPLSTYTEFYFKQDLHNLLHFLYLRCDNHSQFEIRQYATAIFNLIKPIVPITCEAFEDYRMNARNFSAQELDILRNDKVREAILNVLKEENNILPKRELSEFREKLKL